MSSLRVATAFVVAPAWGATLIVLLLGLWAMPSAWPLILIPSYLCAGTFAAPAAIPFRRTLSRRPLLTMAIGGSALVAPWFAVDFLMTSYLSPLGMKPAPSASVLAGSLLALVGSGAGFVFWVLAAWTPSAWRLPRLGGNAPELVAPPSLRMEPLDE